MLRSVVIPVVLCLFGHAAAGQEFYQQFLQVVDTNELRVVAIKSPLLVDTNNTAPKLTNAPLDLNNAKELGQIGEIRLGMTMEQVVAAWGKPRGLYSRCFGGPRFLYAGVDVIFKPASNSVKRIVLLEMFPRFAGGLSASSAIEEIVRILGQPSAREDLVDGDFCDLTYETGMAKLKVSHCYGRLQSIQLDRLVGSGGSKAYSAGDSPIIQSNPPAGLQNP